MVNCRVLTLKRKKNVNYQLSLTGFDSVNHELNMILENWQILPNMSPLLYFIWFSGQNCHPTSAFLIYVPFKYDSKYFINIYLNCPSSSWMDVLFLSYDSLFLHYWLNFISRLPENVLFCWPSYHTVMQLGSGSEPLLSSPVSLCICLFVSVYLSL